ncbi:peroxisomal membrane anchor protein conserved region-domain-containing protein [Rhodotorula diobovata]|uniref:Peroxisomal membrane protein PEX14 n=1 Tax=Rhodotorula diobovata TaxID=5288 RepID=A0A5C5FR44_9BASI|nr:peroxisomal membrane anchor protein conserved region-domain-containing protein [Rhodotorula diobovata]
MAQPGAMVPSGDRAQLLASAVSFLRDPATASSPLAQRIAFLESKGLSQPDIELALQQAGNSAPAPPYPGAIAGGRPPYPTQAHSPYGPGGINEFQRDWRDWFIMSVFGGGVGWLAVKLAQKFLVPHLQPPTETDLEASQRALEAKYDEAAELLKTLQESTDAVAQSLDEQKRDIEKELEEVRGAVKEMREGEKKRDEWAQNVGRQVDDMVKSLPGLLDKQASAQSTSLADLQTELKSLKSLLIARRPAPTSSSPGTSSPASSTPAASSAPSSLPFSIKPPGLPAWQLKSSSTATPASPAAAPTAAAPAGSSGYTVPGSATAAGAGESDKDKDPSASGVLVEKPDAAEVASGEGADGEDKGKGKSVEA